MIRGVKYSHTNLIAHDWRALAGFYAEVFACVPVPPERDYAGPDLDRGTAVRGARLTGAHLRLPGRGPDGPTLEIYQYSIVERSEPPRVNRPGFGHIAFEVESVGEAREEVLRAGGAPIGDIVTLTTATGAKVTWCYVTDPEGNIIELQSWAHDAGL